VEYAFLMKAPHDAAAVLRGKSKGDGLA
jgi:hypothetical protein